MKTLKRSSLLLTLILATFFSGFAQGYITAAGLRLGPSVGLTVNQRITRNFSVEGIVHKQFLGDAYLTALAKRHLAIAGRGTNLYFGGGLHTTLDRKDDNGIGLDAIAGLEVKVGKINLSADYKPMFNFASGDFENHFGLSARLILIDNPKRFGRNNNDGPFNFNRNDNRNKGRGKNSGKGNGPFRF